MLHFSYDDVTSRPEVCQILLRLAIGTPLPQEQGHAQKNMSAWEKEVLRFAWSQALPIRPKDVTDRFDVNYRTARNWLHTLVEQGALRPIARAKGKYHCYYEVVGGKLEML